ncbi:transglutaminase family protein [Planctomycetota bacterium]
MKIKCILNVSVVFAVIICLISTSLAGSNAESDEKEYFAVFMESKKVGHAIQSRIVSEGKVTTTEDVSITISRGGISMTVEMKETSIETTNGEPLGFESTQKLGVMGSMKMKGQVDKQGIVSLTTTSMGNEQKSTMQWPQGAVMAEGMRLQTLKKGLKEGTQYSIKIFSAGMMQAVDTRVSIGPEQKVDLLGRVVTLREVKTALIMPGAGEIVTTGYVDQNLRMQKSIMPMAGMQVELVACAREFALGQNDVLELIDRMFLKSPEPLRNLASTKSITYDLIPVKEGINFTIPSSDNQNAQKLGNGKVMLKVEPVTAPKGVKFPYKGTDAVILEALEPTRFLQSDNEQIIKLARRAIGRTKDAAEAARKIEAFVGEYIDNRSLSVGYASAAEVVASRQGDCSEFAVLTAAMCRAVGIPAQVVAGVAYVDDFLGNRGFGGHAWTQAYIGGKWIGLDASFRGGGRGGYDAGHIALAVGNGEPGDMINLASTVGQFKVDKVTVEKK